LRYRVTQAASGSMAHDRVTYLFTDDETHLRLAPVHLSAIQNEMPCLLALP
jgi:hypothetical protein